jgi:hypothetical protein
MAIYIILGRFSPGSFSDPKHFKELAATVAEKIKQECPGVQWHVDCNSDPAVCNR